MPNFFNGEKTRAPFPFKFSLNREAALNHPKSNLESLNVSPPQYNASQALSARVHASPPPPVIYPHQMRPLCGRHVRELGKGLNGLSAPLLSCYTPA